MLALAPVAALVGVEAAKAVEHTYPPEWNTPWQEVHLWSDWHLGDIASINYNIEMGENEVSMIEQNSITFMRGDTIETP